MHCDNWCNSNEANTQGGVSREHVGCGWGRGQADTDKELIVRLAVGRNCSKYYSLGTSHDSQWDFAIATALEHEHSSLTWRAAMPTVSQQHVSTPVGNPVCRRCKLPERAAAGSRHSSSIAIQSAFIICAT